jgi:acetoin utilization deacetylase AcuC-like enzyme
MPESSSIQTAAKQTALLADPISREHDTGPGHPEQPLRFDAVVDALDRGGLTQRLLRIDPRPATEDEIALCHGRGYIEAVHLEIRSGMGELSTGDTAVSERSWDVALNAAGGILNAVDAVVEGSSKNGPVRSAFCVVRPPGHHARPDQGMGFCIFKASAFLTTSPSPRAMRRASTAWRKC